MVYEFMAKIKNIKDKQILDNDYLSGHLSGIHERARKSLTIQVLTAEAVHDRDILIKSEISVSSLMQFHEEELSEAVESFKYYVSEIAGITDGEISRNEGFYHNSKTFKKLY